MIVGPLTIPDMSYINIDYQYVFVNTQDGQVNLPYSANLGYELGSKINLMYKDEAGDYYAVMNPINLAFRKPGGACRTSESDQADYSVVELAFGQNLIISCLGTENLITQNIFNIFNHVGKYAISSNKLSQFINVTKPSIISKT